MRRGRKQKREACLRPEDVSCPKRLAAENRNDGVVLLYQGTSAPSAHVLALHAKCRSTSDSPSTGKTESRVLLTLALHLMGVPTIAFRRTSSGNSRMPRCRTPEPCRPALYAFPAHADRKIRGPQGRGVGSDL